MKVEVDGRELHLHFKYSEVKVNHVVRRQTECTLTLKDGATIGRGSALCSEQDNFVKETGRKISLAKALKDANFSREERTLVWQGYFDRFLGPLDELLMTMED